MKILKCPWTLLIDSREQNPWTFESIALGGGKERRLLEIKTEVSTLKSGDYSVKGMEDKVAIERKSLDDLYNTLGRGRGRFVRELERLNELDWAAVIVEREWYQAVSKPPARSQMYPSMIDGAVNAWMQRFPGVHWLWRPGRYVSSKVCFKVLHRFWEDHCDEV